MKGQARRTRKPAAYYELRPDRGGLGMVLDEIVAEGCTGFHMEAMDKDCYWFCLDFPGGQRLMWHVYLQPKRRRLMATVFEDPGMLAKLDKAGGRIELRPTRKAGL